MKRKLIVLTVAALPLLSEKAMAAPLSGSGVVPVIVNLLILAGAVACLTIAVRLFLLVKGGALARGWQLWVISFFALVFGQILIVAEKLNLFSIGFDIAGLLYLATVVLLFVGLLQTRKVLE
jgi:hypothetical protein